jgi:diguanylate cyclase (GGDEF)-like protein
MPASSLLPAIQMLLWAEAAALLVVGAAAWRRRNAAPAARPFTLLMLCGFLYCAGYAGEIAQTRPERALAWLHMEYLGIPWIPGFWAWTALEQSGRHLDRRSAAVLFLVPAVVFLGFHTNSWHHLFYDSFRLVPGGPFQAAQAGRGGLYWLHITYACGAFLIAFGACVQGLQGASRVYRIQALAMFGGALAPFAALTLLVLRRTPGGLDPVPFATGAASVLFFAGIFRYALFDLVPVARSRVFEDMRDAVLVLDPGGRLTDLNGAARNLLSDLGEAAIGRPIAQCLASQPALAAAVQATGTRECACPGTAAVAGRHLEVRAFPLRHRHREVGHAAILADIGERIHLLAEVQRLADSDPLTGLANRRRFAEALHLESRRSTRKGTPFGVLLLDVDHFKQVNDRHGHPAGDAVLKALASRVQGQLRDTDLLARHGGEEFVVLLPETDLPQTLRVAERVRRAVAGTPMPAGAQAIPVTVSLGAAVHPGGAGATAEALLAMADQALYRAKAGGRDRVEGPAAAAAAPAAT